MNPTAGSFVVDPRLQRLFVTLAVETPGVDSLMMIYGSFLHGGRLRAACLQPACAGICEGAGCCAPHLGGCGC